MKAISLWEPWATLVALGKKKIETRSWKTDYRGPLAIHAAKKFTGEQRKLCSWFKNEPFASALKGVLWDEKIYNKKYMYAGGVIYDGLVTSTYMLPKNLHLGCVIAVCQLVGVVEIPPKDQVKYFSWLTQGIPGLVKNDAGLVQIPPVEPELSFGDYTPGRFAWILRDVRMLDTPVPVKGKQRLWEWDE